MRVLLALIVLPLSGCLDGAQPVEPAPQEAAVLVPDAPDLPALVVATKDGRVYDLATSKLQFDHALKRFALVADGPATVRLHAEVLLHEFGDPADCAILAAHHEPGAEEADRVADVRWFRRSGLAPGLDAQGSEVGQPDPATGSQGKTYRASWNLSAGERVIVQLGGSSPAFALMQNVGGWGGFPIVAPNEHNLTLNATGRVHMEALPDAPLRCGVAHHGARTSLAVGNSYASVAHDASASLEASDWGTLMFHPSQPDVPGRMVTLSIGGNAVENPSGFDTVSRASGGISMRMERWIDAGFDSTEWLMVASALPIET